MGKFCGRPRAGRNFRAPGCRSFLVWQRTRSLDALTGGLGRRDTSAGHENLRAIFDFASGKAASQTRVQENFLNIVQQWAAKPPCPLTTRCLYPANRDSRTSDVIKDDVHARSVSRAVEVPSTSWRPTFTALERYCTQSQINL